MFVYELFDESDTATGTVYRGTILFTPWSVNLPAWKKCIFDVFSDYSTQKNKLDIFQNFKPIFNIFYEALYTNTFWII